MRPTFLLFQQAPRACPSYLRAFGPCLRPRYRQHQPLLPRLVHLPRPGAFECGNRSLQLNVRFTQVAALADPPARAPCVRAPSSFVPFPQSQPREPGRVVPLSAFGGLQVDIEEFIREIPALNGTLRPLITDHKRTTPGMEILQRVIRILRASSSVRAPSRGNRAGMSAAVRHHAFQQRARRAEAEAHQARLQVQELRPAC